MADFERKLAMLAERGTRVGPEEMIERVEAQLAEDPLVVVTKQRKGWGMSVQTDEKRERKQGNTGKGLAWAAATFVAVIGIAALYFAFGGEPEGDVVEPAPPTTVATETTVVDDVSSTAALVEILESAVGAYYAGDYEGAAELMDFAAIDSTRTEPEWRDEVAYFRQMNAEVSVDCATSVTRATSMSCAFTYADDLVRVIYGDVVDASDEYLPVGVVDGKVTHIELVGPDSPMWSMGIYLAGQGNLAGFEDCMGGNSLTPECAEIQQAHLADYEDWHSEFDATELVTTGMEAWFEGDCALAITMFAGPIADELDDCLSGTAPEVMAYEREMRADVEVTECQFEAAEERAFCTITYSNALHEAVDALPAEMTIELLVTPVEKALWFYQQEFYRYAARYPHDAELDESFQTYADEQGFGEEHASACRVTASDMTCARLRLDNLDDWAAWHRANN